MRRLSAVAVPDGSFCFRTMIPLIAQFWIVYLNLASV